MQLPFNLPQPSPKTLTRLLLILGVLTAAILLPLRPYNIRPILLALLSLLGAFLILTRPGLGFATLITTTLIIPLNINTGTEVTLNPAILLIPALTLLWVINMARTNQIKLTPSPLNRPIALFLLANLIALLISNATWDKTIPRSSNFILVQLAQWAILLLALSLPLLVGNRLNTKQELRRLTFFFLGLGSLLAILTTIPTLNRLLTPYLTQAINRPPFWIVLSALAIGQLTYNQTLPNKWRLLLLLSLIATGLTAFIIQRDTTSYWLGIVATGGTFIWLKWPRLRWLIVGLFVALLLAGLLIPAVYEFAGGEDEWLESGGSRIALITRVLEVTIENNPLTGLGPAGYRPYANATPLTYLHIVWVQPNVSSHNNFVDIFSYSGLIGFSLFIWLTIELARLGLRLRQRHPTGFLGGYITGMIAAGAGSLTIMLLADWILPFVYNIGFAGFQSSLLFWLFYGGLVAIERWEPT